MLHVVLPTIGSAGDVHPVIALGTALRRRGHRVTIITNGFFREIIERQGLAFLEVGTAEDAQSIVSDPDLWHARRGFSVVATRAILPAMEPVFRHIERLAADDVVVAASGISFGARIAQERLGLPLATVHLQPSLLRSLIDAGMFGTMRVSAAQPMWLKRTMFWLADRLVIDKVLKSPVNAFRARLGLPPVDRLLYRWMHSPDLVVGFFPDWFAAPQPDWPPHTHLVGFPLWDTATEPTLPDAVRRFLGDGEPPLVFTPGSAAATLHRYFAESVAAVRMLKRRAMFVTNFPEQVPRDLPPGAATFSYVPFSLLLPHAAMLAYHGGIGTLAQATRAAVPQLVVPNGHDQFDNGWRIEQLGVGRSVPQSRYRAAVVARTVKNLLADQQLRNRSLALAVKIDGEAAVNRACALI